MSARDTFKDGHERNDITCLAYKELTGRNNERSSCVHMCNNVCVSMYMYGLNVHCSPYNVLSPFSFSLSHPLFPSVFLSPTLSFYASINDLPIPLRKRRRKTTNRNKCCKLMCSSKMFKMINCVLESLDSTY